MPLLDMLKPEQALSGPKIEMESQSLLDVAGASWSATRDNHNSESKARLTGKHWGKSLEDYKAISGVDLEDELADEITEAQKVNIGLSPRDVPQDAPSNLDIRNRVMSEHIEKLKTSDPEKYKNLKTQADAEGLAKDDALKSLQELSAVAKYASPTGAMAGSFLGGLAGAFTDPINLATMPFGASAGAGVLKTMRTEAVIGVASEALIQPNVAEWQKQIGVEYGLSDVMTNLTFAGVGAAGISGGIKGAAKGIKLVTPRASEFFTKLGMKKGLTAEQRTAAKNLELTAHVNEANPHIDLAEAHFKKHVESIDVAQKILLNEGRALRPDDLPISSKEFDQISTTPKEGMTASQLDRLKDLERFQTKEAVEPLMKSDSIGTRNLDAEKAKAVDLANANPTRDKTINISEGEFEEALVTNWKDGQGVVKTPDGKKVDFAHGDVRYEATRGMSEGQRLKSDAGQAPVSKNQKALVRRGPDGKVLDVHPITKERYTTGADIDNVLSGKALSEDNPMNVALARPEKTANLEAEMTMFERSSSPETVSAEKADFDRMIESAGDTKVELEDGRVVTLKQMGDELAQDDSFVDAMKFCSTGA